MNGEQILLNEEFPSVVLIGEIEYKIHFGFKTGIRMDLMYHDEKYTIEERYANMMHLFYPVIPDNAEGE